MSHFDAELDPAAHSQGRRGHRARDGGGWGPAPKARQPRAPRATVSERLELGQIDAQQARELTNEAVLRSLTASAKSRHDLERSLARRGYPPEQVTSVLDRLTEVGLIDDQALAESLVRARHAERGLSRRAIAQELQRKGIDPETAGEALEQLTAEDEHAAASRLAEQFLRRTTGQPREARLRKAASALARRGYGPGLAYRAVQAVLAAEE